MAGGVEAQQTSIVMDKRVFKTIRCHPPYTVLNGKALK